MRVFRLCLGRHRKTALDGEGARLAGGRWNHKGTRMVYCSESRSLAAMEYFVNLDSGLVPTDLICIAVEVPDGLAERLAPSLLPHDWKNIPGPASLRDLGSSWIAGKETVALMVPSAVVPDEHNVLLNPAHADFKRLKIHSSSPFSFDPRMWK